MKKPVKKAKKAAKAKQPSKLSKEKTEANGIYYKVPEVVPIDHLPFEQQMATVIPPLPIENVVEPSSNSKEKKK